jgi:hypothetical protein
LGKTRGQTKVNTTIDLTGLATTFIAGIFTILGIVIPLMIQSHMKDKQAATVVANAVKNSLGTIQQAGTAYVTSLSPEVRIPGVSPQMQAGIQYVLNNAGPEAARLGITPEGIASKIDAQLGLANIAANLATAGSPSPSPAPLAPTQRTA